MSRTTGSTEIVHAGATVEARFFALRQELDIRIFLQNLFLLVLVVTWAVLASLSVAMPVRTFEMSLVFDALAFSLAIMWSHSGVRHAQMRGYLLEVLEPEMSSAGMGWERYLRDRRPASRLGSRWWISTHGLFAGLPIAFSLLVWRLTGDGAAILVALPWAVLILWIIAKPAIGGGPIGGARNS